MHVLTVISLIVVSILYIGLLIAHWKNKNNVKINAAVQILQAVLWIFIAVDNWADSRTVMHIMYIIIIVSSLTAGIKGIQSLLKNK